MVELTDRAKAFRAAIAAFIEARREAKLKGNDDDAAAASKYEYTVWLADAAKRAGAIQLTTHPLKATFPDAKIREATSPFVQGVDLFQHQEVGTHLIEHEVLDGTGDAASLGTFKFLAEVLVEEKPLVHWFLSDDPDLLLALSQDEQKALQLASDFKRVLRTNQPASSHSGAKQVYWLVGEEPEDNSAYHLLQPLFSSSLAHAVHAHIQDARFGEANKLARRAFRAREPHDASYRDYRNLVARKLGGTKPQNISQLNSERGGVNYLLASLPPAWRRESLPKLLHQDSALAQFRWFEDVRPLLKALADFLLTSPDPNKDTRDRRESLERALSLQLPVFAASIHTSFLPGWTRSPDCRLPLCEQLWLDPERSELPPRDDPEHAEWAREDRAFNTAYNQGHWPDEIASRFANWVNERLHEAGLTTVGDAECKHWAKQAIVDAAWPVPMQRRASGGAA